MHRLTLAALALAAQPAIAATILPYTLNVTYRQGSAPPLPSAALIEHVLGQFAVTVASHPAGWLRVSPTSGVASANMNIAIDPRELSVGSYVGIIAVSDATIFSVANTLQVNLTVLPPVSAPPVITPTPSDAPTLDQIVRQLDRIEAALKSILDRLGEGQP